MTTALSVIVVRQIMNKPSNYLTNFTRSKRNLSRLGLLVLAVLMTLGAAASPAGATPTVQVVLPPTPSGTAARRRDVFAGDRDRFRFGRNDVLSR